MTMARVRVLIIHDSPLARRVLSDALAQDPTIEVVAVASDELAGVEDPPDEDADDTPDLEIF